MLKNILIIFIALIPLLRYNLPILWVFAFVIYFLSFNKFQPKNGNSKLNKSDYYFLGYCIIMIFTNLYNNIFEDYIRYLLNYLSCFTIYYVLMVNYNSDNFRTALNKSLLIGLGIVIFIVLMQFLGIKAFYLTQIDDLNQNTNFENATNSFEIRYWGPFSSSLILSTFFVGLSVFFLHLFSFRYKRFYSSLFLFGLFLLLVFLTGSRSGLLLFVFFGIYILIKVYGISRKTLIAFTGIILAFFFVFFEKIQNTYFLSRFESFERDWRFIAWLKIPELLEVNYLFGVGAWNINPYLFDLSIAPPYILNSKGLFGHVESIYLTVLVSTGLIGFYFFIVFLFGQKFILRNKKYLTEINKSGKYAYYSLLTCGFFEPSILGIPTILMLLLIFRYYYLSKSN